MVRPILKKIWISFWVGVLAGCSAAVFLILLDGATRWRDANLYVIFFLPGAGLAMGWVYSRWGRVVSAGSHLIIDEIHDPKKIIPFRMAPLILLSTVATHLFGGSAGREGTAVQMGASLADQLNRFFRLSFDERAVFLMAGAGAGFGAAVGAPWAGAVFGVEVIAIGRLRLSALPECVVASFVGYLTTLILGARHSVFPKVEIPSGLDPKILASIALAGIFFGVTAWGFVKATHGFEWLQRKIIPVLWLQPFVGGVLLVAFYQLEGSGRFAGLGIPEIQQALEVPSEWSVPAWKAFFTMVTVGSGFKGGEFIPLVFVGTTLGSALSSLLPVSVPLLAAVGFAAVFAGASHTPIACTIMAMEIFGFRIAPYAWVACWMSYYCSGHSGIYRTQRINHRKGTVRLMEWIQKNFRARHKQS